MHLRAAIVPPRETRAELRSLVHKLGLVPGVQEVPDEQLDIPITTFGNLTPADAQRLAGVLRSAIEGAEGPVVRFSGLVPVGKDAAAPTEIAVGVDGEVEPLRDLARFVPEAAEGQRLYVDRRRFRPALTLVSVTDEAPTGMLASAVEALRDWQGSAWSVPGLSLLRTRWTHGKPQAEEFAVIRMT